MLINLLLLKKNQCSLIEELKLLLAKEKAIYTNMNLLNISNNVFYGYAWVAAELGKIIIESGIFKQIKL